MQTERKTKFFLDFSEVQPIFSEGERYEKILRHQRFSGNILKNTTLSFSQPIGIIVFEGLVDLCYDFSRLELHISVFAV